MPSLLMNHVREACSADTMSLRYEMLQDNVEGYRKEIASLRAKEQKIAAAAQKSDLTVHTLTQELKGVQEKLSLAEVGQRSGPRHSRTKAVGFVPRVLGSAVPHLDVVVCLRVVQRACARRGTC